jgi:hypothetical protein
MTEMQVITGHVRNGHLIIDEPTNLPEGTEVELVVIRVVLPNGQVIEGEALEQLLHGARRQAEDATR